MVYIGIFVASRKYKVKTYAILSKFKVRQSTVVNVDPAFGYLHHVELDIVVDISDGQTTSFIRVEVSSVACVNHLLTQFSSLQPF